MSYYYISMYSPCPKESSQRISKASGEVLSESFQGNQCAAAVCVHARVTVCRPTLWGPLSLTHTHISAYGAPRARSISGRLWCVPDPSTPQQSRPAARPPEAGKGAGKAGSKPARTATQGRQAGKAARGRQGRQSGRQREPLRNCKGNP